MNTKYPLTMLAAAALLGTACARNAGDETGAAGVPDVDQVTDSPESYIGRTVTVRGEMDDVRSPRAFTLEDHDWVFQEELLVIAPNQPATASGLEELEDEEVTVTGTVRRLVVTDLEREFDLDLEREFEVEFRDRPILIADRITPDPTSGRRTSAGETSDTGTAGDTSVVMVRAAPVTDVLVLLPGPGDAKLVGQQVRLDELEVRSRVGDRGFWAGPSHTQQVFVRLEEDALIIGPGGDEGRIEPGYHVAVSGTIRRVPDRAQVQSEWGLDSTQARLVARNEALYVAADSAKVVDW